MHKISQVHQNLNVSLSIRLKKKWIQKRIRKAYFHPNNNMIDQINIKKKVIKLK